METSEPNTRLTSPWLLPVRLAWWFLFTAGLLYFVLTLPDALAAYNQVCEQPPAVCVQLGLPLSAELVELLAAWGIPLATYATIAAGIPLISSIVWLLVGLLIYWRKSDDWLALLTSLSLILIGFTLGMLPAVEGVSLTSRVEEFFADIFPFLLFAVFFALFPNGCFVPRAMRWLLPLWLVLLAIPWMRLGLSPPLASALDTLVWFPFWFGGILAQWYRYRAVSTPAERSQTRWVMFGLVVVAAGLITNITIALIAPELALILQYSNWITLAFTAVPVSIGIAILRYQLWDIDVLIRKTLVYSILTALLALFFAAGVIFFQRLFVGLTGEESELAVVASTLAIAALFTPLRRRIQDSIDRRFYRRRYDAALTLARFAEVARNETDLEQLTVELVQVMDHTMQPAHISLWLKPVIGGQPGKLGTSRQREASQ
jgi:hypothetical protein